MRTTIGLSQFQGFTLEGSYVGFQNMQSSFELFSGERGSKRRSTGSRCLRSDPVSEQRPLLRHERADQRRPGNSVILYDRSYEANLTAKYWSGEVNVLLDYHTPDTRVPVPAAVWIPLQFLRRRADSAR